MLKRFVKLSIYVFALVVIFTLFAITLVRKTGLDCKMELCKDIPHYTSSISEEEIDEMLKHMVIWCGTDGHSYSTIEELQCNRRCKSGPDLLYYGPCKPEDASTYAPWEIRQMTGI